MMEAVRTSETSVDNHFTRQYIPEDNSEQAGMGLWPAITVLPALISTNLATILPFNFFNI
jgi:hypothetical protein